MAEPGKKGGLLIAVMQGMKKKKPGMMDMGDKPEEDDAEGEEETDEYAKEDSDMSPGLRASAEDLISALGIEDADVDAVARALKAAHDNCSE